MAEFFANGSLRFQDGEWRDDNGDIVEIAEVKHGEWILHNDGSGTCKVCGRHQKNIWDMCAWQKYCGHCGAKMNGERRGT